MSGSRGPRGTGPSGRRHEAEPDLFGGRESGAARRGAGQERARPRSAAPPDEYPGATSATPLSVAALTNTARDVIEGAFPPLWVRGEVTNFAVHSRRHWYFSLRDGQAQVRCVVWAGDTVRIPAPPDDGMQVTAFGQLSVYPARGDMRFIVKTMEAVGDGLWRKALELARARLERDGLLAPERKRPLPWLPRRIAVVTSPDGAALHDIISVVRRRCSIVEIVVVPARVQGDGAVDELVAAIERVSRWRGADTVIVGRGGGSREDLWAFNDERVARALAACSVPTISAVGHEVDVSLCDLVADARAATPSAAAEAAVPVLDEVRSQVRASAAALRAALERRAAAARALYQHTTVDLRRAGTRTVERRRARLDVAAGRLHALSPLTTLARGFAVARDADGRPLVRTAAFAPGSPFTLTLRDGEVDARAEHVRPAPPPANAPSRGT